MSVNLTRPIELKVRPVLGGEEQDIGIFTSYSFDRNILVPASAFRFTAEGVEQSLRLAIRSGDTVGLYTRNAKGKVYKLSTGFIDETDTHITASSVSYVLTGRDTLGQLVDNAAVDAQNNIVHGGAQAYNISQITAQLVQNTRMSTEIISKNTPGATMLYQTNPGETKISVLQRYLEITNCLAWSDSEGRIIVGKPTMNGNPAGKLWIAKSEGSRSRNNVLEVRVRRASAMAIRQIAVQMQDLAITDPAPVTIQNFDEDVRKIIPAKSGRSVYRTFSMGNGTQAYDNLSAVGAGEGLVSMGKALALREMAMDNTKVLDVECIVQGHLNENGDPYDIDQIYEVFIEDENLASPLYVYAVRHDLTRDKGPTTSLRLCKIGALVWGTPAR